MKDDAQNNEQSNRAQIIADFNKIADGIDSATIEQFFTSADPSKLPDIPVPFEKLQKDIEDNVDPIEEEEEPVEEEEQEEETDDELLEEEEEEKTERSKKEALYKNLTDSQKRRVVYNAEGKRKAAEHKAYLLEQEVNYLKEQMAQSARAGSYHYAKAVQLECQTAEEALKAAIKSNDATQFVEAQKRLNDAQHALNEIKNAEYNLALSGTPEKTAAAAPHPEPTEYQLNARQQRRVDLITHDYPEINPESRHYNEKLALKVEEYIEKKNRQLTRDYNMEEFGSSEYFDEIEDYIDQQKSRYTKSQKDARPALGGVRSVTAATGTTTGRKVNLNNVGLSDMERDWARMGVKDPNDRNAIAAMEASILEQKKMILQTNKR